MAKPVRVKRFYKDVMVAPKDGRFAINLDGRAVKTPGGAPLLPVTDALARAIADEWACQGEFIDRSRMPLTGIQTVAIDDAASASDWREDIVKYLGSDLVCYRALEPAALAERQAALWDPYVNFLRQEFGALLITTSGVVAVTQPDATVCAVRNALIKETAETLFAVRIATAIAGSAALALALWREAFTPEEIFNASRIDERFQEEQWGADEEAKAREFRLEKDFLTVARFLSLLK